MVEKANSWLIQHKSVFIKIFFICLLTYLTIRGIKASWEDLKDYAFKAKLEEQATSLKIEGEKTTETPKKVEVVDKNKILKEKILKEKGIILTDEDIKRYGITDVKKY